ncbi:hypothetical protein EGT74_25565 [Chitinophaga lutea]|uniref:Uncharacterized protein n=1 Tax=Chitinophaga lutea TaxID=2488634 RepID=A0A3N4PCA8_9BACT|nr:hypothetical protein [Chitinophaga lutea]RPE05735.1 hypothetical protein EGT74_25565 [Chitinophaga lutea]
MCGGKKTLETLSQGSASASTVNFDASMLRLNTFLQKLNTANEEIRIWVPATSNFGNQTSTIMIMYRLISMGALNLRIIWVDQDPDGPGVAWRKLQILILGLPDTPPTVFQIGNANVYFSEQAGFNPTTVVRLGITGGWDGNSAAICTKLQTSNFCCLQPYLWSGAQLAQGTNVMYVGGPDMPVTLNFPNGVDITRKAYYVPPPALTTNDWLLFKQLYPRQEGCIRAIDDLLDRGIAEMMPIYFSPGRPLARFPDIFFNVICGIIFRNKALGLTKPTIIPMLAGTDPGDYNRLRLLLQGSLFNPSGTRLDGRTLPKRYEYLSTNGYLTAFKRVLLLDTDDNCIGRNITLFATSGSYDVIVAAIRREPKVVFDYVFSRTTLLNVLEGMSTASLVLNLGTPFFHLQSNQTVNIYRLPPPQQNVTPFSNFCNNHSDVLGYTQRMWEGILNDPQLGPDFLPSGVLGRFINTAVTPFTFTSFNFLLMKSFFSNQQNDKLLAGLFCILEYADS